MLFVYVLWGAIEVLPEDGYVTLCKDEVEEALELWDDVLEAEGVWEDYFDALAEFMEKIHPIALYGFLAMNEQLSPDTYGSLFAPSNLVLNLLFNMGQQYEDVRDLIYCFEESRYLADCEPDNDDFDTSQYFEWLGYTVGDFLIRIIYRKHYADIEVIFF